MKPSNTILYLDTSEPKAHLAIFEESRKKAEVSWEAPRELSKTLSEKVKEIFDNNKLTFDDLAGIVVFVGPGSFTGLRIGISYVNGLAFALSIPVYETKEKEKIDLKDPKETALPFYGAEPRITEAKKRQ